MTKIQNPRINHNFEREFEVFVATPPATPPQSVSGEIFCKIQADLLPSIGKVFSKLALIHIATSLFTLSVCPQFGFSVFETGMGLNHLFMAFGETGCAMACGFFFLGSTAVIATLLLKKEDLNVLKTNRLSELTALTLISLGFFIMMNAQLVLSVAIAWFLGSVMGGALMLETEKFVTRISKAS